MKTQPESEADRAWISAALEIEASRYENQLQRRIDARCTKFQKLGYEEHENACVSDASSFDALAPDDLKTYLRRRGFAPCFAATGRGA